METAPGENIMEYSTFMHDDKLLGCTEHFDDANIDLNKLKGHEMKTGHNMQKK